MKIVRGVLLVVLGLLLAATLVAAIPSNSRWVRIFDFPRVQTAVLLVLVFAGWAVAARPRPGALAAMGSAVLVALLLQASKVWPYTRLHAVEAPTAAACAPSDRFSVLVANVLYTNRNAAALLQLVRSADPDLVLLLETNAFWNRELDDLDSAYPHRVEHPRPDGHGIHLLSRNRLVSPRVRYLFGDYRPSIWSGVRLPSGETVGFYGLHPAPPPLKDTARRDAEILIVAQAVRAEGRPALVAGDFNDVPWSRTTRLFAEVGGLSDPRIGRGLFTTFSANWPLFRWPLDHVFHTRGFTPLEIEVGPDIGSDHLPYMAVLCRDGAAAPPSTTFSPKTAAAAARIIAAGREVAR